MTSIFRNSRELIQNLSFLLVGVSIVFIGSTAALPDSQAPSAKPTLLPPKELKYFTLGYNDIVADSLWLRTIQDFDYCENRQDGELDPSKFKCEKGWVYNMIDAITEIAPAFDRPYYSGALMLSVIVNDVEGASAIFDKGVARFPSNWGILYNASYQAMIEEKNPSKAAKLLMQAGHNGAPQWVFSLAARLQQKSGQLDLAKSILENAAASTTNEKTAELFQRRLDEVNAEIAKQRQQDQKH